MLSASHRLVRNHLWKAGFVALIAALAAAAFVGIESRDVPDTQAQGTGTASCGSSPLNGRTQVIVDAIVDYLKAASSLTSSQTCSDATTAHLTALLPGNTLDLRRYTVAQIRAGDFANLSAVSQVDLSDQNLTAVPASAFAELATLSRLNLSGNAITSLPAGAFTGVKDTLTHLYLNGNELTTLPATIFHNMTSLTELELSNNKINSLPNNLFNPSSSTERLSALDNLYVNHNRLDSDDLGFLTSMQPVNGLLRLRIGGNGLTHDGSGPDTDLPSGVFSRFTAMTSLQAQENRLKTLPASAFPSTLEILNLATNGLTSLTASNLSGLSSVRTLLIQENRISDLPVTVLNALRNTASPPVSALVSFQFFDNGLTSTEQTAITNHLVSANGFTALTGADATAPAGFGPPTFPTRTLQTSSATNTAGSCGTSPLNGRSSWLNTVVVNVLKSSSTPSASRLTSAQTCSDVTADHLATILEIPVSGVSIPAQIPGFMATDFDGMTNLRTLNLGSAAVTDSRVTALPSGLFDETTRLRTLNLSYQFLSAWPAEISGLTQLRDLDLSYNKITSIPANALSPFTKLRAFSVRGNSLASVPINLFDGKTELRTIHLDGNPATDVTVDHFIGLGIDALSDVRAGTASVRADATTHNVMAAKFPRLFYIAWQSSFGMPLADCGGGIMTGRSQEIVDAIVEIAKEANVLTSSEDCSDLTTTDLANVTPWREIDLSDYYISAIRRGDFAGLTDTQVLRVEYSNITRLPANVFEGMTALQSFLANYSDISDVHEDAFNGITTLRAIRLDHNELTTLPAGVFDGLTSVTSITLRNNAIDSLPATVFDGLTSLATIDLNENVLGSDDIAFTASTSLRNLRLRHNALTNDGSGADTDLPATVFSRHTGLQQLELASNRLKTLPTAVFSGLTSLTHLRLENNLLASVPGARFTGLSAMTNLTIEDNGMSSSHITTFTGHFTTANGFSASLSVTTGESTAPTFPTRTAPTGTPSNPAASCGSSPLNGRSEWAAGVLTSTLQASNVLTSLETCSDVTADDLLTITSIPPPLTQLPSIPGFRSGDLDGLTNLRVLILGDSSASPQITANMPSGFFTGTPNLVFLQMPYNFISQWPTDAFQGMNNLQVLDLSYNKLTEIPANAFAGMPDLRRLNLRGNEIATINANAFQNRDSLRRILLEGNPWTPTTATFTNKGLNKLRDLRVGPTRMRASSSIQTTLESSASALPAIGAVYWNPMGSTTPTTPPPTTPTPEGVASCGSSPLNGRTQKVVDEIMLVIGRSGGPQLARPASCSDATLTHLDVYVPAPHTFDLSFKGITQLRAGDFSGIVTANATVNLRGNELTTLPSDVFNGMTGLSIVTLDGNRISSLPADAFASVKSSLTQLQLNDNELATLNAATFSGMSALTNLQLRGNALDTLPSGMFTGMTSLTSLNLNDNFLRSDDLGFLTERIFSLTNLLLADNILTHDGSGTDLDLPAGVFNRHTGLAALELSNNRLRSLPSDAFTGLTGLQLVELDGNLLSSLPTSTFTGLTGLYDVFLNDNGMSASTIQALTGHLVTANGFTTIRTVTTGSTAPTFSARAAAPPIAVNAVASCGSSPLHGRSQWLANAFVTSYNAEFDPDVANCSAVTSSHLEQLRTFTATSARINGFTANDFAGMTDLRTVTLGSSADTTAIRQLPSGLFRDNTKITKLSLPYNYLSAWPTAALSGLTELREIDLSYNQLTSVPAGALSGLSKLRTLNLRGNQITTIAANAFTGTATLRTIWLEGNPWADITTSYFAGLNKLRSLRVGTTSARATSAGQRTMETILPSIGVAYWPAAVAVTIPPTPTPTPTLTPTPLPGTATPTPPPTATPTRDERIQLPAVNRIVPSVREITVTAGTQVRLSFDAFNVQSGPDNDIIKDKKIVMNWSVNPDGGSFTEFRGGDSNNNGQPDDREVLFTVPSLPGRYVVTAEFDQEWRCRSATPTPTAVPRTGTPSNADYESPDCAATFTVMVRRSSTPPTPVVSACPPTSGTVPTSLTDADGAAYAAITPRDGGRFDGDGGVYATVPENALADCNIIGIRVYSLGSSSMYAQGVSRVLAGDSYRVEAISRDSGDKLEGYQLAQPARVCVPLPDAFRANLSGVNLVRHVGNTSSPLTTTILTDAVNGLSLCGAVSQLPADVTAAGPASSVVVTAAPTPPLSEEFPETGGGAPSYAYVLLAILLGAIALALSARLVAAVRK